MANLKIEGDVVHVSETQLNFISKVLEELGYKNKTVVFSPLGKVGDNYMANIRRITVENDDGTSFVMIAKLAVQDPMTRYMMNTAMAFKNEAIIYTEVLPKYVEIETAANVPENNKFLHPKCYGVLFEQPHEVILLEDQSQLGFQMLSKFKPLSDDAVKIVLDNLAHLHALSYAWRDEDSEAYDATTAKLQNSWTTMGEQDPKQKEEFFGPLEQQVRKWIDDEKLQRKYENIFTEMDKVLVDRYHKDVDSKLCVIQHGDSWTNNFLFKVKNSTPTACTLIDYQMSKPNKPAADLLYLFFTSTLYEQRVELFKDWLNYYHESLDKYLSNLGKKASEFLTRDQLDADIKDHADSGLRQSLLVTIVTLREASEATDFKNEEKDDTGKLLNDVDMLEVKIETMKRLQERAKGMFKTVVEYGLVD